MQSMSQTQNTFVPRAGQEKLITHLEGIKQHQSLNVQWPTGYGKSIGFAIAWKRAYEAKICNRFLLVVANDTQRRQIQNDFAGDCELVGAPCPNGVWVFERSAGDIASARRGDALVFVCTVQQLHASMNGGLNTIKDLLRSGIWFVGFDEYHHFGEDMPWGNAANCARQESSFCVAMSATPDRRNVDTIFGKPDLVVTYSQAVREGAVKPIVCHSYEYGVTVVEGRGMHTTYSTSELMSLATEGINVWEERKSIRYSPQYIHPLITHPVTRLKIKRSKSGMRLQMLVRAMSCIHAKAVCDQIRTLCEYEVDWVGTGFNGRTQEENRDVIARFCPPKTDGIRPEPELDILVQVCMAGEGFDSINVCEIVDLYPVSDRASNGRATQDKQFYGRGSRIIKDAHDIELHVNIPTDHALNKWAGKSLASWMDASGEDIEPTQEDELFDESERAVLDPFEVPELPKERQIEFVAVITDQEHYKQFKERAIANGYNPTEEECEQWYITTKERMHKKQSLQMRTNQVREHLNLLAGKMARALAMQSEQINSSTIGRYKKEVNKMVWRRFNKSRDEMTLDELERADRWLFNELTNRKK